MSENTSRLRERVRNVRWLIITLIPSLLVMGGTMAMSTFHLRKVVRAKIIQQDGMMLYAASMVPKSIVQDVGLPADLAMDPAVIFAEMTEKVLVASKQQDVIALRLFDQHGRVELGSDEPLSAGELEQLRAFKTLSSFDRQARFRGTGRASTDTRLPLIRALVPLQQDKMFIGAAEFMLDGTNVAAALDKLDQDLWFYSGVIFVIGGAFTATALGWSFNRLQRANRLLADRTRSLLRANHELTLAAKTSAVGAITAHLIHDLKSPLFGLQSFVSAKGSADDEDWEMALNTTQRMQKVITEIVRILQEEKTTENYELSIDEVLALLRSKLEPQCDKAGISFKTEGSVGGSLMNRDANIILLLITNIVQNAIQATPQGGEITVSVAHEDGQALFDMRDTGPGLPENIQATLFTPSRTTKAGGTGLGLAISKQLANHIGAELVLKETSKDGTIFQLRVPERLLTSELVVQ